MTIARNQIIIDASEFLKGMSSGAEIADGGFSDETEAVNLIVEPGVVYAPAAGVDADTDTVLTGEIIASSPDDVTFLGNERKVVTNDGKYYIYNGTKLGAVLRTDAVNTYTPGFVEMVTYGGETYITTRETLVRWDEQAGVFTASFLDFSAVATISGLADLVPHPLMVFENNLYVATHNELFRTTTPGTAPTLILTLSADQVITALGVDSGTGQLLIATGTALNVSATVPAVNKVLRYDGFSNKVSKAVVVENTVFAFHYHQGNVFVGYGQSVGIVSGSGITSLKKLKNVALLFNELPYKKNFASIGNTMYVVDKTQILAFGPIRDSGSSVWYYAAKNKVDSNIISAIFDAGKNKLAYCTEATDKIRTIDLTSKANLDKLDFSTNWLHFPRPVFIREVVLETVGQVASSGNFTLTFKNDRAQTLSLGTLATQASVNTVSFVVSDSTDIEVNKCRSFKLRIENATENDGIRRIIIYYDVAE